MHSSLVRAIAFVIRQQSFLAHDAHDLQRELAGVHDHILQAEVRQQEADVRDESAALASARATWSALLAAGHAANQEHSE
ncbi:MAG: hypothetical protein QOC89_6278 [Paraburkholderia sp.]|nr:hypothetical protein [Paraburkholderia sp.]